MKPLFPLPCRRYRHRRTLTCRAGMGAGVGWTLPETIQEYGQLVAGPDAAGIGKTQYDFVAQGYKQSRLFFCMSKSAESFTANLSVSAGLL